jgi:hypothetical protein
MSRAQSSTGRSVGAGLSRRVEDGLFNRNKAFLAVLTDAFANYPSSKTSGISACDGERLACEGCARS